jgi:hypothetical protein
MNHRLTEKFPVAGNRQQGRASIVMKRNGSERRSPVCTSCIRIADPGLRRKNRRGFDYRPRYRHWQSGREACARQPDETLYTLGQEWAKRCPDEVIQYALNRVVSAPARLPSSTLPENHPLGAYAAVRSRSTAEPQLLRAWDDFPRKINVQGRSSKMLRVYRS